MTVAPSMRSPGPHGSSVHCAMNIHPRSRWPTSPGGQNGPRPCSTRCARMHDAIDATGLTIETYEAIASRAEHDRALRAQIEAIMTGARPPADPGLGVQAPQAASVSRSQRTRSRPCTGGSIRSARAPGRRKSGPWRMRQRCAFLSKVQSSASARRCHVRLQMKAWRQYGPRMRRYASR